MYRIIRAPPAYPAGQVRECTLQLQREWLECTLGCLSYRRRRIMVDAKRLSECRQMVEIVTPKQAWEKLAADPEAQLVDVRTDAEWQYVGLPDLRPVGRQAVLVSWQYYPSGRVNPGFVDELRQAGLQPSHSLYFLCRSGVRSMAAAQAAESAGFGACSNVAYGFEGHPDGLGHRGTVSGWKADGLPWCQ